MSEDTKLVKRPRLSVMKERFELLEKVVAAVRQLDDCPPQLRRLLKRIDNFHKDLKKSKAQNARNSIAKAKANGSRLGRKRTRDDVLIRKFRRQGYTIRQIAKLAMCSTAAVQRSLEEIRK